MACRENMKHISDVMVGKTILPEEMLGHLYARLRGNDPKVVRLPGGGSDRLYFRMIDPDGHTAVGTWGADRRENRAFVLLSECFRRNGVPVPEIYACDDEFTSYIQEDLGDTALLSLLSGAGRITLSEEALRQLVMMQTVDESGWRDLVMASPFSRRLIFWDLNYFKYEFLKPSRVAFDEDLLEDEFETMSKSLLGTPESMCGFMYRDFQSRNIMVKDGRCRLIDYQGGRKGNLLYDAVSFLWQAKAGFSPDERKHLLAVYAETLSAKRGIKPTEIISGAEEMALLRTLQVLGAYGFRGLVEKKSHFIESIPGAISNLTELMEGRLHEKYPELARISSALAESQYACKPCSGGALVVKVFSFSYKKGYPEDLSGNGGGFMFDCRGMHNPGRYEQYRDLTGLDREVIEFLESKGEAQRFVEKAFDMVAPSVRRYIDRGFNSLQIGFGCTGGRHRSVYCAEHAAHQLAAAFPEAIIEVVHREQGIKRIIRE